MRLYLDNCMFNRPFDNQTDFKILLESEAKLKIQEHIRFGLYELVWSYILDYENSKNPFRERREQIGKWKKYANVDIDADDSVIELSKSLNQLGLKNFDALHIACAITAKACSAGTISIIGRRGSTTAPNVTTSKPTTRPS